MLLAELIIMWNRYCGEQLVPKASNIFEKPISVFSNIPFSTSKYPLSSSLSPPSSPVFHEISQDTQNEPSNTEESVENPDITHSVAIEQRNYNTLANLSSDYDQLKGIDPRMAEQIHPNDIRKIKRYLQMYEQTGLLPSMVRNTKLIFILIEKVNLFLLVSLEEYP